MSAPSPAARRPHARDGGVRLDGVGAAHRRRGRAGADPRDGGEPAVAPGDGAAGAGDRALAGGQHVQLHVPRLSRSTSSTRRSRRRCGRSSASPAGRALSAATAVGWVRGVPAGRALGGAAPAGRALPRAVDAGAVGAAAADGAAPRHVLDDRVRRRAAGAGRVRARQDARAGAGPARAPAVDQQPSAVAAVAGDPGDVRRGSRLAARRAPRAPRRAGAAGVGAADVRDAARLPASCWRRCARRSRWRSSATTSTSSTASGRCRTSWRWRWRPACPPRGRCGARAARRRCSIWGLWLLSLALVVSAVRGLMFFGVVSVAVFQRCVLRAQRRGRDAAAAAQRDHAPHSSASRA